MSEKIPFSSWHVPRKKKKGFVPRRKAAIPQSQMTAFYLCLESEGRPRLEVNRWQVHNYIAEKEVRYEFDGENIYRTVDAFHFISAYTLINGRCRSFNTINVKILEKEELTGEETFSGVHEKVINIFNKRYFVGRSTFFTTKGSDLNREIQGHRIKIQGDDYFIIQIKNLFEDGFTKPRLFRGNVSLQPLINPIAIKMDLPEIIAELEKGEIKYLNHYGDNTKCHSPTKVIDILKEKLNNLVLPII